MFGTMCKPLHAGSAAENGLFAAQLAAHGFDSRNDVLECDQGFAATQSDGPNVRAALASPQGGYHLLNNLFKYHAACYLTHAPIECCSRLRNEFDIQPADVKEIVVRVDSGLDGVCNIENPATGTEAKFSLRLTSAFALAGIDTASISSYRSENCADPVLVGLRDRVRVEFQSGWPATQAAVGTELHDGRRFETDHDSGIPSADLDSQRGRLVSKFHSLVDPLLPTGLGKQIAALLSELHNLPNLEDLVTLCRSI